MNKDSDKKENKKIIIETERLRLIPCELSHFEAILHDGQKLASLLQASLAEEWLGFDAAQEAMQPCYEYLKFHPEVLGWWTYLFIHKPDRTLIGLGGFKGVVDAEGMVEIGYAIAPGYQRRGLATESSHGMIQYAISNPRVKKIYAHTLPEYNASTRVLEKVGFELVGTIIDPADGEVWRWRLRRKEYQLKR